MEFFGKVGPGETWYLWSLATYESVLIVQKRCAHKKVKKCAHKNAWSVPYFFGVFHSFDANFC